jgi:N-acetylmuramoyl-L-alanine amidase
MSSPSLDPSSKATIHVVYPKPGQKIFDDSSFIMGSLPDWKADQEHFFINDDPVPVSAQGFFSQPIPVPRGAVTVFLKRQNTRGDMVESHLRLEGVAPLTVLPPSPLAIHSQTLQPATDLWLSADDTLTVACSASENAQITVSIPGLRDKAFSLYPVSAIDPNTGPYLDTRQGVFAQLHWTGERIPRRGASSGQIAISALLQGVGDRISRTDLPLVLTITAPGQSPLSVDLPGRLSILEAPLPATIMVPWAVTRLHAVDGARATPLPVGVKIQVDGLQDGWARTRLPGGQALYIALDDLKLVEPDDTQAIGTPSLENIQVLRLGESESEVICRFAQGTAEDCPVQIRIQPLPMGKSRLIVQLFNVTCRCDFIHYPPLPEALIEHIHWRAVTPRSMEVWIDLRAPLFGYTYEIQEHSWCLRLKTLPKHWQETRILLDPGHGGTETGSTGLDGRYEKDLNLKLALKVREALQQEGFTAISITRSRDLDLSLNARGKAVNEFKADIVLSLHHNALPDGRDPRRERGVSVFYYHPFAKSLADDILQGLTQPSSQSAPLLEPLPALGVFYDSLYMTRLHQAMAVLVEFGFFTSPGDFEKLIDPAFQLQEAQKLAQAVKKACDIYKEKSENNKTESFLGESKLI